MRVEIVLDKYGTHQRVILGDVNGRVEISRIVTDLALEASAHQAPKLQLTLVPDQIIIDADIPRPVALAREWLLAGGPTQSALPFADDRG